MRLIGYWRCATETNRALTTPFAHVQDTEEFMACAIGRGHYADALAAVIRCVDTPVPRAELTGRALFGPFLDQLVCEIGARLLAQHVPDGVQADSGVQLVVATETIASSLPWR